MEAQAPSGTSPISFIPSLLMGLAAVLLGVLYYFPVVRLGAGLDPSHQWVLAWAASEGLHWGTDILFTYGPLGFLRTSAYHPWLSEGLLILRLAYYCLLSFLLWRLLCGRKVTLTSGLLLLVFVYLFLAYDTSFDSVVLFLYLAGGFYLLREKDPHWGLVLCLVGFFSLSFFLKYTFALVTCLLLGIVLLREVIDRKIPVFSLLQIVGIFLFGFLAGHHPGQVGEYLIKTWPISSGYSFSMMLWADWSTCFSFLGLSAALTLALYWHLFRGRHYRELILLFLWCSGIGFLIWKQSFIRQDGHVLIAGAYLILLSVYFIRLYLDYRKPGNGLGHPVFGILIIGFLLSFAYSFGLMRQYVEGSPLEMVSHRLKNHSPLQLGKGFQFLHDRETLDEIYTKHREALAEKYPLPDLQKDSDFFNARVGILLANEIPYAPRPVFQSYTAYTPSLIRMNASHLESDAAAHHLAVDFVKVDERPALLADGLSWLTLFRTYETREISESGAILIWDRVGAEKAGAIKLELIEEGEGSLGDFQPMPGKGEGPYWIEVEIEKSWWGKIQNFLFKASPVELETRLTNGKTRVFRTPPGMLQTGFLFSPHIEGPHDLLFAFATSPSHPLFSPGVREFRFREKTMVLDTFRQNYSYRLYQLNSSELPLEKSALMAGFKREHSGLLDSYRSLELTDSPYQPILANNDDLGHHVFSHAPTTFKIQNPFPGQTVKIEYGLRDGSWQEDAQTDGVQFAISEVREGETIQLFEDLLQPFSEESDRGVQTAEIALPEEQGILIFETKTGSTSNWDWSFWRNMELIKY